MGRDKAGLPLAGVANATRLAKRLGRLFEDVLIVGGEPPEDTPGRRVADVDGPQCALRGVVSALAAAETSRVLLLATDLPLVSVDLLLGLVAWPEFDAVVARDAHGPQPLCGVYRREVALDAARARLGAKTLALAGWLESVDLCVLPDDVMASLDPEGVALANLNTPKDLPEIERRVTAQTRE